MKYKYRKKGKFGDNSTKIIIEEKDSKGNVKSLHLPKPQILWDNLKRLKMIEGLRAENNHEQREPLINELNRYVRCKYCDTHYTEYKNFNTKVFICPKCLFDFRAIAKKEKLK